MLIYNKLFPHQLITMDDPDEEALSNFLMKHGLTDQKWVSYFHEHNITKPDQILAVKGSVELYMALSSQEKAVLRKGLKIDDEICIPQSAIPLTDVQERKKQCEELFSMLGLTDFSPQKLTLRHALEIREDTLLTTKDFHQHRKETKTDPKNDDKDTSKGVQHTDPKLFPFFILQKIMAFDYKSRGKLICSSLATTESKRVSTEKMPDKYSALDGEDDDDNDDETMTLHPMDGLLALLHCSDNFLRQDLFSRLATCQLAIPLLMPDPFVPQITFPLWAMRSIVKEWECTQKSGRTISHEELLISYRAPLVSFMRFGTHNVSKSQILNSVISESKHDIFFHFNCDGGSAQQLLVSGLVEVCWYLPSDHIFPDVVSFANLHGDARRFSKQVSFLSKVSFMNFVFLNKEDLDSKAFQVLNELATAPGGLVVLQTKPTADNKTWHELSKSVPKEKFSIIKMTRMNEAEITDEVRSSINETLHEKWTAATGHRYTFEEFTSIAHNCNEEDSAKGEELAIKIVVDEEERDCAKGKELADHLKRIIHEFISAHPDRSPKELLPLQSSDLWHKWAFKHKEQYRQILRGHQGIEEYSAQQREEMNLIRSRQFHYVQHLTPLMKSFIQSILSHKGCVRKYFLHWLQLILDNVSRKQLPLLRSQYQEKRRELLSIRSKEKVNEKDEKRCRREIDELNSKMINSSFGLEHLLRETCQIYEAVRAGTQSSHRMFRLPAMAAELMIDGYPLELMDGDAAHVPMTWVSAVLDEVREKLIDPRVLVLSILGLQGTGKSTLMNTLFGLRFSVSAGRCTRGAFMQLLPIHPMLKHECKCDYLLIVDTEGLRAPELNYLQTQKHDNELATFIIGLANLTVINIFGETTGDLDDILQTAVHAFLRMKEVKLTCSCQFVHQNVPAVMAGEKGMMGRINFKEKLNQMTQAAAKEENLEEQYKNFRQIIEFDEEDDVYHFPGLWKGDPPMAPVNPGYSKKAQEMRLQLIKFAKAKPALPSGISASITRLTVFQAHIKELWKAILHENFVFSFKNTLEIDTLDAKYVQLSWSFQRQMMQWEQKAQNELKSCPRAELDEVYKRFVSVLPRHVREIYRSLKEDLETLFKESPEGEIMAKWKTKTEIRLSSLHDQLQTHAENHCKQISTSRRALAKADEMKASHRKRILKHVKELAAQLEQGTLNDEELEQRFNEQWIKWIAELRAIPVHLVDICVSFDVEKSLTEVFHAHNAMIIQKLTDRPLQKWGSPPKLKMVSQLYMQAIASSLKTTRFAKAIGFTWPGKCLHHAQKVTDDILEQVQKYLMEKQNDNYNPGLTNELLQILSKEINEFNSKATEFKFTSKFKVDIALTACGYALKKFELMVEAYRKKVDPVEYIEREIRESLLVLFKNQYFQVAQEKAAAVTLCDLLSKSVKKQVISSLSPRIVEDMRGNSQYFQSKPALKAKILLDIGEELNQNADFDHCALYLKDIKRSLQWWIKHYTTQHCKQGRLVQLGVIELSVLISCISQTAHEVTQDISPEQEEFSINDWLTKFHGKLQGRLEMDVTEFRDLVGAQQLKNVRNFNEEVRKGLRKLETKLQNEFLLSMDVSAMDQWETKPYDFIFKNLAGCTEQCPFCHEQCDLTNESHIPSTKHSVAMHRPRCLGGYRWTASGEMCLDICTALVGSDRVFRNHDTNNQDHPYKKYRDVYPQWIILDDKSAEISSYWKWLVGHYTSEVAQLFNMKEAEIPLEWKELSWHSVRKDLENMY